MSTTTYARDCTNSLGIPVDNLSLGQTVERIVGLAKSSRGPAELVSTLNVDFLVNALGYAYSKPRHPELLQILRSSTLVTADGFPIVWISKIIGKPLGERVAGSDLVPAIAERIAREDISLFLLGGQEGEAAAAAKILVRDNPGLDIAGTAAPYIHVDGPLSAEDVALDDALVEQINGSGASILLLGLGNPKQELWFHRNRHRLRVAIAIGVGGTFNFINGNVRRAPKLLQQLNLEWVFRITQDPRRLIGRYAKGLVKFGLMAAPLFYYRAKEALFYGTDVADATALDWKSVWSSRDDALNVLSLPRVVSPGYLARLVDDLDEHASDGGTRLLDFSRVSHVSAAGHQELFRLSRLLRRHSSSLSILGMNRSVMRHLQACRVLDLVETSSFSGNTINAISSVARDGDDVDIGCQSYVMKETTLIFLSGHVTGQSLAGLGLIECMEHAARDRTCILDLRNVTLIESSAITQLQALFTDVLAGGKGAVMVSGIGEHVAQMFQITGLVNSTVSIDDNTLLSFIAAEGAVHDA